MTTVFSRIAAMGIAAAVGVGGSSTAQEPAPAARFDAKSFSLDFETQATVLESVQITDGNVSISAARASRVDAGETEQWSLIGEVVVAVDSAVARADSATLRFSSGQLVSGELVGEPVEVEDAGEDPFRGSARRIAYDDVAGVFSATGNASFSVGAQAVHCNWVYDVRQRAARGFAGDDQRCTYVRSREGR